MAIKDITHGMSGTRIYESWCNMKARCNRPTSDFYYRYGGRGIGYHPDWETFEGFYRDMHSTYYDGASLERLDVDADYSITNCIWIPLKDQAKNKGKPSNNTSGFTGCDLYWNRVGVCYVRCRWNDINGKSCAKYFNITKHGEVAAWRLAIQFREAKLVDLGYGVNHGK